MAAEDKHGAAVGHLKIDTETLESQDYDGDLDEVIQKATAYPNIAMIHHYRR